MAVNLEILKQLYESEQFIGKLVRLAEESVERDGETRQVIRVEVWSESGERHLDTISAAHTSQKLKAWMRAVSVALGQDGNPADITETRYWAWKTGGGGQFTYNVLVPGEQVEPPACDEQDLAFLADLGAITEGVSPDVPFQFSKEFGNEIAGQYPKLHEVYRGDSVRWIRALCVKGVLSAEPGEWPGEVIITSVYM